MIHLTTYTIIRRYSLCLFCVTGLIFLSGCPEKKMDVSGFEPATNSASSSDQRMTERLFDSAIQSLNRLELDSGLESGQRVTGRLNEWIKTAPIPADWTPDAMTPAWQKNNQDKIPLLIQAAQSLQNARQEISDIYGKMQRLEVLYNELSQFEQAQKAGHIGGISAETQKELEEKIKERGDLVGQLNAAKTPQSLIKSLEALEQLQGFFTDAASPGFDSSNVETLNAFVKLIARIKSDGIRILTQLKDPEQILVLMDKNSAWLNQIASDLALDSLSFPEYDINYLQESIWFRDASRWGQGESADDPARVAALFDWTVKNIALITPDNNQTQHISENEPTGAQALRPLWDILLSGRGTAEERAWVFSRLAQYQGLDVVIARVEIPERPVQPVQTDTVKEELSKAENKPKDEKSAVEFLSSEVKAEENADVISAQTPENSEMQFPQDQVLPEAPEITPPEKILAAWISDTDVYFFDLELGVPIPAPNGITLINQGEDQGLKIQPASLKQILADPSVLAELNYTDAQGKEHKYPALLEDFKNLELYIPVSPTALSKRMWILQSRLTGENYLQLTSQPTALKERIEKTLPGAKVSLWVQPYAVSLFCPMRQNEANNLLNSVIHQSFGDSTPLYRARVTYLKGKLIPETEGDDCAVVWYQKSRLSDSTLQKIQSSDSRFMCLLSKLCASYWLGLLSDAQDNHEAAVEYFTLTEELERDLAADLAKQEIALPRWWAIPSIYNSARVEEEMGAFDSAIEQYNRAAARSQENMGSALRAWWITKAVTAISGQKEKTQSDKQ